MVGVGAPGQTTMLFKQKLGETVMTLPTIGFNVDTVVHNNTSFAVWDVGGHDTTHLVWKHNLHNTHGLIFVVDSTDHERITEAHDKLHTMLAEDKLRDTVVVVFANKQDLPQAMSVAEMTDKLGLVDVHTHKWCSQAT